MFDGYDFEYPGDDVASGVVSLAWKLAWGFVGLACLIN